MRYNVFKLKGGFYMSYKMFTNTLEEVQKKCVAEVSQPPYMAELGEYEVITNLEIPNMNFCRVVVKDVSTGGILTVLAGEAIPPGTEVRVASVDYMQTPVYLTSALMVLKK